MGPNPVCLILLGEGGRQGQAERQQGRPCHEHRGQTADALTQQLTVSKDPGSLRSHILRKDASHSFRVSHLDVLMPHYFQFINDLVNAVRWEEAGWGTLTGQREVLREEGGCAGGKQEAEGLGREGKAAGAQEKERQRQGDTRRWRTPSPKNILELFRQQIIIS